MATSGAAGNSPPQPITENINDQVLPTFGGRTAKVLIALVGDSTVTDHKGWGVGFTQSLVGDVQCVNLASSGRSSKSYRDQGRWKQCLEVKPDYVLIQFGHNDQKIEDPLRGTDPQTTFLTNMTRFIDEAREKWIKPVLITSVGRRQRGADGKIFSTFWPYVDVVKQIAANKQVPLIDLHEISIALYEKLGREAINEMSPIKPVENVIDDTHFNLKGGTIIGRVVAEELTRAAPELAGYIKV